MLFTICCWTKHSKRWPFFTPDLRPPTQTFSSEKGFFRHWPFGPRLPYLPSVRSCCVRRSFIFTIADALFSLGSEKPLCCYKSMFDASTFLTGWKTSRCASKSEYELPKSQGFVSHKNFLSYLGILILEVMDLKELDWSTCDNRY